MANISGTSAQGDELSRIVDPKPAGPSGLLQILKMPVWYSKDTRQTLEWAQWFSELRYDHNKRLAEPLWVACRRGFVMESHMFLGWTPNANPMPRPGS